MPHDQELAGEVGIVTGAGRNIGRAIAETLAAHGAKVVIADIDGTRATETADAIAESGGDAIAVTVDVRDETAVEAMIETTEEAFGPVDILVNNAAVTERADFLDVAIDEVDRVLAVNLRGTFLCSRAAARSMQSSNGGRIVHIASTSAHVARPTAVAYAATKRGILSFTKSMANALAEYDIRVNAVSPTRTGSRVGEAASRTGGADDDILVGRWGEPKDQAEAVLFLVSDRSGFVNGAELVVDGGAMASTY